MYIVKQNPMDSSKMSVLKTVKESAEFQPAKVIGTITLLNLIQIEITDQDDWTFPTEIQRDNLRRVFGIDIQFKED